MAVGKSALLCSSRSSVNSALRSKTFKSCGSAALHFFTPNDSAEFPAGETNRNVIANRDLRGVADDLSRGLARDRVAAFQDHQRTAFPQDSLRLAQTVSPLRQVSLEVAVEPAEAFVELRAFQPDDSPEVVADDAGRRVQPSLAPLAQVLPDPAFELRYQLVEALSSFPQPR